MLLLWLIILTAPFVFFIRFKMRWQTRQFVAWLFAYLFVLISIFWMSMQKDEQIWQSEAIVNDFIDCVQDSENFEEISICHVLLDSDIVLYNRANY